LQVLQVFFLFTIPDCIFTVDAIDDVALAYQCTVGDNEESWYKSKGSVLFSFPGSGTHFVFLLALQVLQVFFVFWIYITVDD
jgi:hypothetical protein